MSTNPLEESGTYEYEKWPYANGSSEWQEQVKLRPVDEYVELCRRVFADHNLLHDFERNHAEKIIREWYTREGELLFWPCKHMDPKIHETAE